MSRSRGEGGAEQSLDPRAAKDALAAALGAGTLVALEPLDRVGNDPCVAAGEAHDALERRECAPAVLPSSP
jgi:hypothetical protein